MKTWIVLLFAAAWLPGCASLTALDGSGTKTSVGERRVAVEEGMQGSEPAECLRAGTNLPVTGNTYPAVAVTPDGNHAVVMPPCGNSAVVVHPDGSHSIAVINGATATIVTP